MADLGKLYRCTLCQTIREQESGPGCRAKGDKCGFQAGAVEAIDATPGAFKAMWRQNNAGSVRGLTWGIVLVSVILLVIGGIRMAGG
ncbi:MAG: hypothetical protein AAFX39_10815 [Pseudomonadota bacterium]